MANANDNTFLATTNFKSLWEAVKKSSQRKINISRNGKSPYQKKKKKDKMPQ